MQVFYSTLLFVITDTMTDGDAPKSLWYGTLASGQPITLSRFQSYAIGSLLQHLSTEELTTASKWPNTHLYVT